jgi:hypothetical protein
LEKWTPPWEQAVAAPVEPAAAAATAAPEADLSPEEAAVRQLLFANPAPVEALAALLGVPAEWRKETPTKPAGGAASSAQLSPEEAAAAGLLAAWPTTAQALAGLLPPRSG